MNRLYARSAALCLAMMLVAAMMPAQTSAKTTFVTIGTGGLTGVYYPTGGAIAQIINKKNEIFIVQHTIRCRNREKVPPSDTVQRLF